MIDVFTYPPSSPIEHDFLYHFQKYRNPDCTAMAQFDVQTLCGKFVLDFMIHTPAGRKIGIECDGAEFHDRGRDAWRDAMILGERAADAIYRLRGTDIYHRLDDVLLILSRFEEDLFSPRGCVNLRVLASREVVDAKFDADARWFWLATARGHQHEAESTQQDGDDESDRAGRDMLIERRLLSAPSDWAWMHDFATSIGGGPLDVVIERWREIHASKLDQHIPSIGEVMATMFANYPGGRT